MFSTNYAIASFVEPLHVGHAMNVNASLRVSLEKKHPNPHWIFNLARDAFNAHSHTTKRKLVSASVNNRK